MTKVSEQRMKLRIEYSRETDFVFSDNIPAYADWLEKKLALSKLPFSGLLQDIQEVIEFLQWAFRKVDKGDTPQETVRMLLMYREKIDNIKFDSNDS